MHEALFSVEGLMAEPLNLSTESTAAPLCLLAVLFSAVTPASSHVVHRPRSKVRLPLAHLSALACVTPSFGSSSEEIICSRFRLILVGCE